MTALYKGTQLPRIPVEVGGIQVNFCRNPRCPNFGQPPVVPDNGKRKRAGTDSYRVIAAGKGKPTLHCLLCHESPPLKSNLAVVEEFERMLRTLKSEELVTCPNPSCENNAVPIDEGKGHYQKFGKTAAGSTRWRCIACRRVFSEAKKATLRQRTPEKNDLIFRLLVNKSPMRRICEVAGIGPETLYQRIGFFASRFEKFAATHERKLMTMKIPRLHLQIDRQEYVVNWTKEEDKRNVRMHALGTADSRSGYVFGMHLNFDSTLDAPTIEAQAAASGDIDVVSPYRRFARLWLRDDYTSSARQQARALKRLRSKRGRKKLATAAGVSQDVARTYTAIAARGDVEVADATNFDLQLPTEGMQIHAEYTLYGHFQYLKVLLADVGKIRFYMDQESGIRAACFAAFSEKILKREVDAFYVTIDKSLTVNERRRAKADADAEFESAMARWPGKTQSEVEIELIKERMAAMQPFGKWSDRWLVHPFPSMSEPDKAVCFLTDLGNEPIDRAARLYQRASLHAIDRFFMQLRRRISLLERPIATASASSRVWHGYSPYSPIVVERVLTIFRTFYNFMNIGEDKKTPAMRLGLATRPMTLDDVLELLDE